MTELPICRQRGEEFAPGRYKCYSRKLWVGCNGVGIETCSICPYVDHPDPPRAKVSYEPVEIKEGTAIERLVVPRGILSTTIQSALTSVGITDERITEWLGRPCGCDERRRKLDRIEGWARRVLKGKVDQARQYLEEITK